MADLNRLQEDLRYVRASVAASSPGAPPAVYYLWAALALGGFMLPDFRPAWTPAYWAIAAPGGALLSGYLGWRHQRTRGHLDGALGSRYALHWGSLVAVIFLGALMVQRDILAGETFGPIVLLLLAQGYFHAGIHLDRPLLWVGVLMALGYLVVLNMAGYEWTMVGVMVAAALLWAGTRARGGAVGV